MIHTSREWLIIGYEPKDLHMHEPVVQEKQLERPWSDRGVQRNLPGTELPLQSFTSFSGFQVTQKVLRLVLTRLAEDQERAESESNSHGATHMVSQ